MNETMHIHDEAAAYALHALSSADHTAVEAHADHCPPCRKTLDETSDTAQMLALVAGLQQPPARIKQTVMARIERDTFLMQPTRRSNNRSRLATFVPIAAALTLLTLWNVRLQSEVNTSRTEASTARQALAAMQATAVQSQAVQVALVDAEATHILQARMPMASNAKAVVYMSHDAKQAVLSIKDLPPPPIGKVYQVWLARPGMQQPCETFMADHPTVMVHTPEPMSAYTWIMVTLEDGNAAQQPSEQRVLFADL